MTTATYTTFAAPTLSVTSLVKFLTNAVNARAQRNTLRGLNASQMADIGVSYKVALREAKRPIWAVPHH